MCESFSLAAAVVGVVRISKFLEQTSAVAVVGVVPVAQK